MCSRCRAGRALVGELVVVAYGVVLLQHAYSLRAAGVTGKAPPNGGAIEKFVSTMTDNALWIIGTVATLVVSADMADETAYAITKAVFDNFDDFRKLHPALASLSKQDALKGETVPFHPGAIKYFKEAGLM